MPGVGLDKKDFLGKSDPYYELSRQNPDGSFTVVYRSETIPCTLCPKWKQHEINVKRLCTNPTENPGAPILVSVTDLILLALICPDLGGQIDFENLALRAGQIKGPAKLDQLKFFAQNNWTCSIVCIQLK